MVRGACTSAFRGGCAHTRATPCSWWVPRAISVGSYVCVICVCACVCWFTCARTYTNTKTYSDIGIGTEWMGTNTKRSRVQTFRGPTSELSPDTRVCTHRVYLSSLSYRLSSPLSPHSQSVPRSDRLKWFVFDLTTTAAATAAAAAAAAADAVDGGTLFPPRTLPSFNVSRRMCVEELHALLALGIRDRETLPGLSMILVCSLAGAGRVVRLQDRCVQ